jgi:hypothetical protein
MAVLCAIMDRLSKTAVKELLGRMPEKSWQQWLYFGLLRPPGPDGRWEEEEVKARIKAAKDLEETARGIPRRALHLQRAGHHVEPVARKRAVLEILRRVRPAARKMREVRMEMDALARRVSFGPPPRRLRSYGIGLPREDWMEAVNVVDLETFDAHYANAARWAESLPDAAMAEGRRLLLEVPFDERVSLLLVNLLIKEVPMVRERLRLPPIPVGGPTINP